MGYLHINNLYKDTRILEFKECYALEKIHGTSAHVCWNGKIPSLQFFSGGMSHILFEAIFDKQKLKELFIALGHQEAVVVVYGEAYGGKEQGMSNTYGKVPYFTAFDVKVGEYWVDVLSAENIVKKIDLEFVPYEKGPTDLSWLNSQRDADSIIAIRRGMGHGQKREGVVLRTPFEVTLNNGERLITKHKRDDFRETKTPRAVDPAALAVLTDAQAIADEWVTPMRLDHILQKLPHPHDIKLIPEVIKNMVEDVVRESIGEAVITEQARKAIQTKAVQLYKKKVMTLDNAAGNTT